MAVRSQPIFVFSRTRLRYLRQRAGLSIEALAAQAQVSYFTILRYEQGRTKPDYNTAARLASVLDCKMEDLADRPGL